MSGYDFCPLDSNEPTDYNNWEPPKVNLEHMRSEDYEFSRYGEPLEPVDYHRVTSDRERLLKRYRDVGYGKSLPNLTDKDFRRHVALFRAQLDLWEEFSEDKVFSKDEIYYRCIQEGPSFTDFIKKTRSTTLRALTSETVTDIDEEFYHPERYDGYNSIIHERYLIHWDDRKNVDDVKYCFMPVTNEVCGFEDDFDHLLDSIPVRSTDFEAAIDVLQSMKNTQMYDPNQKKSHLMREFWTQEITLDEPYYARRTVVLTFPGSTRDTGVGTPSTIAKVKAINKLCRVILQACQHSANAPSYIANERLVRVLGRTLFLHVDFKKYGLTFPRALMNIALRKIGERYGFDVSELLIDNFFIEIDGVAHSTERGTCLGWLDCLNELCVHAILCSLRKKYSLKFDHIGFNDDFELSFFAGRDASTKAEMMRDIVLSRFNQLDIPISLSKTYASRASIFLERYTHFDIYKLNMYKEQLTVKAFAMSLVTTYPWKAKMYFAAAWQWTKNDYAGNRCITTCPREFGEREITSSLVCGGWFIPVESGVDRSFEFEDRLGLALACELRKMSRPTFSTKPTQGSSVEKIREVVYKKTINCKPPGFARERFAMEETTYDLNLEVSDMVLQSKFRAHQYEGSEKFRVSYELAMEDINHEPIGHIT